MANGRRNGGKKARNPSDGVRKESSTVSLGSHKIYEEAPVVTSLPPAVDGHLRCFLRVSVPTIHWKISKYPGNVLVRLKWWGEDGTGVLFRPLDNRKHEANSHKVTSVRYPVCSGPKQFSAYLKDMGPLIFDVVHGESLMSLGQAIMNDVTQLSASAPIHGLFDVISITSPSKKLADLNISLRFESTTAAFSQLSSSIPTVDLDIENQRRAMEESDVEPSPPVSLNPATPINHPRKISKDQDPFVSPVPLSSKGVKFALDSPERFEYIGDHSPATVMQPSKNNAARRKELDKPALTKTGTEDHGLIRNATSSDLIGSLLKRGESLREAMVLSADENSNSMEETSTQHMLNMPFETERSPAVGKLFTELLASQHSYKLFSSKDNDTATELDVLHDSKAVDLILDEEKYHYFGESLHSSDEETVISESGDPLYDESILTHLFYTTPAEPDSEDTISTDDEQNVTSICTVDENKQKGLPECDNDDFVKSTVTSSRKNSEVASATDPKEAISVDNHEPGQQVVLVSPGNSPTASIQLETTSSNQTDFSENLGAEKLTALGRADTARVIVESIMIDFDHWRAENASSGTFFIEYHFPTSTFSRSQEFGCSMATEITRIASKKIHQGVVVFNHRSVFPVFFNAAVTDHWWRLGLTFKVYYKEMGQRMPRFLGAAALPLKSVLQSDTLSSSASLQIKSKPVSDDSLSPLSPSHVATNCGIGPLLVKVELMTDGKPLHVKPSSHKKPPLPSTKTAATKRVDCTEVKVPQIFQETTSGVKLTEKAPLEKTHEYSATDSNMEHLPLYTLLWIPEGKHVTQQGYNGKPSALHGIMSKNNLYLVCRMFWSGEVSKSRVCWGEVNPPFGFKQVSPVILSPSLLQRACNNFMVVEVWNRLASSGDMLIGLVKLPLHQLYLSYRDPKITRTIFKSKYPVVAVDEWSVISNPFTRTQHGYIRVLLTMGSMEQTSAILSLKCGGELPVGLQLDHHLDTVDRDDIERSAEQSLKDEDYVKHQFVIEVEDIRGLSIFGSTVWGETDCYVQYHFPTQGFNMDQREVPSLEAHRTHTTLCVPDPTFHDVAWHTFVLPQGFPVQKYLQAAFSGSWVAPPLVPGLGGFPFELWRRYYYPNIRDQMVAKANLPLAKLCAMVTMQKCGEANVQNFSLPLKLLPGDASDGMHHERVQDTGLMDVTVKYQPIIHKRLKDESMVPGRGNNHVCVSLFITQACGLKAAALVQAKHNPSLSYAAEVGVNAYLVIQIPFSKKHEHVTRTVARTFSPEFSYQADMLLPIVVSQDHSNGYKLSLAEQLEKSQISYEIWHQVCHGTSFASGDDSRKRQDVLLGVGKVPLVGLLSQRTGIKGWFAVYIPGSGTVQHETTSKIHMMNAKDIDKVVGGLELSINFSEAESRDHVIHISRGMGWAPALALDYQETSLGKDDLFTDGKRMVFCLKIDKAWIPSSELCAFNAKETKVNEKTVLYARYKFYDKAPICTKPSHMKEVQKDTLLCELKHSQILNVTASASFTWYMTEECLEIQLWLSRKQQKKARNSIHTNKRDRLIGSGYVNLSDLHICQTDEQHQMSGLFPLFRTGANDLFGACVHVEASLKWVSLDDSSDLHKADSTEEEFSSEESLGADPLNENKDPHHGAMITSHEQEQANEPKQYTTEGEPVNNEDNDTFAAHIRIEQALHLPVISGSKGAWSPPNAYVSYQVGPSVIPSSTKIVLASTSPTWEYQKLETVSYKSLQTQGIVFKVWHKPQLKEKDFHTSESNSMDNIVGTSAGDHVIGFVSFDLAPLAVGMRMLIGWYNIADFNGQCKGQIKLGIAPVTALSPPRPLPLSRTAYFRFSGNQETLKGMSLEKSGEAHHQTSSGNGSMWDHKSVEQDQMEDLPSSQQHILSQRGSSTEVTFVHLRDCSSSGLFSQLRQNMMELDALQQDLNTKLTSHDCKKDWVNQGVLPVHHGKTGSPLNRGDRSTSDNEIMNNPSIQSTVTVFEGHIKYPESSQLDGEVCAQEALTGAAHTALHPCHSSTDKDKGTYSLSSNNKSPISTSMLKTLDISSDIQSYGTGVHFESEAMKDIGKDTAGPLNGRQSSVESDVSTSPFSDSPSVVDNLKETVETRFADLQDSWLSDQEGDSVLGNTGPFDGRKLSGSSFQTDGSVEVVREDISFDSTLLSTCKEKEQMYEKKSDHNSDSSDTTLAEEPSKETQLPILLSGRMVNATLQNFFMPTEKIAESMRALRHAQSSHKDTNFESRLLTKASKSEVQQTCRTKKILFPGSTKRKTVFKAMKDTRPPISDSEADRIAKIFNSSN